LAHAGIGVFRPSTLSFYLRANLTTGYGDSNFTITGVQGTDLPIAGLWTKTGGAPLPPDLIIPNPVSPAPTAAPTKPIVPPSNTDLPSFDG
jgi:hypothetical protein